MRLSRLIQKAKKTLRRAQIPVYAAGAAFFLVLSFLPLTTLLLAVLQYTVFSPFFCGLIRRAARPSFP